MTKTKWVIILLSVMDLILIIMRLTDYFILFLKPTGYVIPLVINIIVLAVIGFRSSRYHKILTIVGLILCIPILLLNGFTVWLMEYSYAKVDSPHNQQSLIIEYRHFTLGETTYFYNFYKTRFGLIGKRLDDQSITIMVRPAGSGVEDPLGLGNEKWITKNIVRFPTWQGMKDVYLNPTQTSKSSGNIQDKTEKIQEKLNLHKSSATTADIESFIDKAKNNQNGQTITINGNRLEIRYDKATGQSWIDVLNENSGGVIPRQQCSRVVPNEERKYYMLEECTHQWEYNLYPMTESR